MEQNTVFHSGETAMQERAHVPKAWVQQAANFIRSSMPQQHREFFENMPVLFLGLLDDKGRPWSVPVFGKTGFVSSPDKRRLVINKQALLTKELSLQTQSGSKIGIVGLEQTTRRRNRMNGTLSGNDSNILDIRVDQSYGNCPQYIQVRDVGWDGEHSGKPDIQTLDALNSEARTLIEGADTFFIATRAKTLSDNPQNGVDASHRGGKPGFLGINENGSLSFPDFSGNRFFNTLGNIEEDGRVGLFIPDFQNGHAVFVTGRATVDWDVERVRHFTGAERIIDIIPESIIYAENIIPADGKLIEAWPVLEGTGNWEQAKINALKKDGYRTFTISKKEKESDVISSFYLEPDDGAPVETHIAGQFLPIKLKDSADEDVLRSYTISKAPDQKSYRLSIKREEHGVGSRIMHDTMDIGSQFEVATPAGDFVLDKTNDPIVFISGGVGITPMIAMLEGQIQAVENGEASRDVYFVHAAMNSKVHAFKDYLASVSNKYEWIKHFTVYSHPEEGDKLGVTHDSEELLSMDSLSKILPFGGYQFYLCGPEGFMKAIYQGLRDTGIDRSHIHYEFFGAGSLGDDDEEAPVVQLPDRAPVRFEASNQEAEWKPEKGTLLELAENAGLKPAHNCRSGKCGTCATKLLSGAVRYTNKPALPTKDNEVFICCAKPASEEPVVLDL